MEFAVIGLGRFGLSLAYELQQQGHYVLAIEKNAENCDKASELLDNVVALDATDPKALSQVEIKLFDKVIVGIGQDAMEASFLTCLNLQECGVKKIIAKASTEEQRKILYKMGIDEVIMPEGDMGRRLAHKITKKFRFDYFEFGDNVRADKIEVTDLMTCIVNKSINTINLRKNFKINIIGIQRNDDIIVPEGETIVEVGDQLLIFGNDKNLEAFEEKLIKGNHGML